MATTPSIALHRHYVKFRDFQRGSFFRKSNSKNRNLCCPAFFSGGKSLQNFGIRRRNFRLTVSGWVVNCVNPSMKHSRCHWDVNLSNCLFFFTHGSSQRCSSCFPIIPQLPSTTRFGMAKFLEKIAVEFHDVTSFFSPNFAAALQHWKAPRRFPRFETPFPVLSQSFTLDSRFNWSAFLSQIGTPRFNRRSDHPWFI